MSDVDEMIKKWANEIAEMRVRDYKAGLNDAWKCATKISNMPVNELDECFDEPVMLLKQIFEKYQPEEAISRIRRYEEI
jgi:hypothetical protein